MFYIFYEMDKYEFWDQNKYDTIVSGSTARIPEMESSMKRGPVSYNCSKNETVEAMTRNRENIFFFGECGMEKKRELKAKPGNELTEHERISNHKQVVR